MSYTQIFEKLNASQKKAATTTEGPLLVVAGPGTGKTLTIICRIAYLLAQGVNPENIIAVTFTNRAAREMAERTSLLAPGYSSGLFIGTLHLLGLRIIGKHLPRNFVIYNREDQINLIQSFHKNPIRKNITYRGKRLTSVKLAEVISRIKNYTEDMDDSLQELFARYQSYLLNNSALDFDDLILKPLEILNNNETLESYRKMFTHIIVDEYQDINSSQNTLLKLLAGSNGNICAVGDADQSIYAFRGADVQNFTNFEQNFANANVIVLSENYRSTETILSASSFLIDHNKKRISKKLSSHRNQGQKITIISLPDERAEGEAIIREIEKHIGGTSHYQLTRRKQPDDVPESSCCFADFVVIFRTNEQAKHLEESFIESGIPYQVVGEYSLYKKRAKSDLLAYLKAIMNPMDNVSLHRVLSLELAGINMNDLARMLQYSQDNSLSLFDTVQCHSEHIDKRIIDSFVLLKNLKDFAERLPIHDLLRKLYMESALKTIYRASDVIMFLDNFVSSEKSPAEAFHDFVSELSLLTTADTFDPEADAVTLMTFHMAKGLEFKIVFITGVEDGIIPYTFSKETFDIEEERRLFYVGMTRAKDKLFLLHARNRFLFGKKLSQKPSPFLSEIPQEFITTVLVPERQKRTAKEKQIGLF